MKKTRLIHISNPFQLIILIVAGAFFTATGFLTPLWAEFVKHLGGNLKTAGIAVSIYSMSYGLFAFLLSFIQNKINQDKFFLCLSYLLYGVLCLGYLFIRTSLQLYCLQLLIAFAGAMQSPVCDSLYSKALTTGKETVGWGLYVLIYTFSIGAGALIGSHIAHYMGFDWVFLSMSAFGITAFLIAVILL
ncbi:MFS transporter [Legionella nagasakiensis]|uniref:MFS transporter n=1 Tax=Legionella nagasakiensis TaxID=535290 RepID=UPI001055B0F3|nr:MFS transporter [Legionella nagasakiensis]